MLYWWLTWIGIQVSLHPVRIIKILISLIIFVSKMSEWRVKASDTKLSLFGSHSFLTTTMKNKDISQDLSIAIICTNFVNRDIKFPITGKQCKRSWKAIYFIFWNITLKIQQYDTWIQGNKSLCQRVIKEINNTPFCLDIKNEFHIFFIPISYVFLSQLHWSPFLYTINIYSRIKKCNTFPPDYHILKSKYLHWYYICNFFTKISW